MNQVIPIKETIRETELTCSLRGARLLRSPSFTVTGMGGIRLSDLGCWFIPLERIVILEKEFHVSEIMIKKESEKLRHTTYSPMWLCYFSCNETNLCYLASAIWRKHVR